MKKIQLDLPDEINLILKAIAAADRRSLKKEVEHILKCYALGYLTIRPNYNPDLLSNDEVVSISSLILERRKKQDEENDY